MTVRIVTSVDELVVLAPQWRRLADAVGARVTAQPLWCLAWWRALQPGTLSVAVAESHGSLVALAPLYGHRRAGLRFFRFLGHGLGAVSEMLVAPGHERAAAAAWSAVLARGGHLQMVDYRGPARGLAELRDIFPHLAVEPRDRCPVVTLTGSAEDYFATRPRDLRRTLRRSRRRLDDEGLGHNVELVRDAAGLARALPEVLTVYDAAERAQPRQHLLRQPWDGFTRRLMADAAAEDRLRLFVGRIDGRAVSFDVVLASGDRLETWLGRFHPEYRRFAPGHLSLAAVMSHALATSVPEVDLGLGDDPYKALWADSSYDTLDVSAGASAFRLGLGRTAVAAGATLRQARRRLP